MSSVKSLRIKYIAAALLDNTMVLFVLCEPMKGTHSLPKNPSAVGVPREVG